MFFSELPFSNWSPQQSRNVQFAKKQFNVVYVIMEGVFPHYSHMLCVTSTAFLVMAFSLHMRRINGLISLAAKVKL